MEGKKMRKKTKKHKTRKESDSWGGSGFKRKKTVIVIHGTLLKGRPPPTSPKLTLREPQCHRTENPLLLELGKEGEGILDNTRHFVAF